MNDVPPARAGRRQSALDVLERTYDLRLQRFRSTQWSSQPPWPEVSIRFPIRNACE